MAVMIVWEVWSRVVEFRGERGRPGTAFLVGTGSAQRLVTARHLCNDEYEEVVYLRHPWTHDGNEFQATLVRVGRNIAPQADFAVFRVQGALFEDVGGDVPLMSDGMAFTQSAFILGYPSQLRFTPRVTAYGLPIVKSCIIAGQGTLDGVDVFFIDAIVNPGMSGGPLVFIDQSTGEPKFAGVVVQNATAPVREKTEEEPNPPHVQAGIGLVLQQHVFRDALDPAAT
jgi:S1-C subfamily serine protease